MLMMLTIDYLLRTTILNQLNELVLDYYRDKRLTHGHADRQTDGQILFGSIAYSNKYI